MYDIQLRERNIVIEKSKHLGLIGVFVQQNYSQTNAPRVQALGSHSYRRTGIRLILSKRNLRSEIRHKTSMIK